MVRDLTDEEWSEVGGSQHHAVPAVGKRMLRISKSRHDSGRKLPLIMPYWHKVKTQRRFGLKNLHT